MHVPVLLKETLEYLNAQKGGRFVDGTVGGGGHTFAIAKVNHEAQILGIDLDQACLDKLQQRIAQEGLGQRVKLVQGSYAQIDELTSGIGFAPVDGILLDLGFSSEQVDDPTRGFSFQTDGPLDMRFDQNQKLTATEVVNRSNPKELELILKTYGEEKFARRISGAIITARKSQPIKTTLELAEIIRASIPAPVRFRANDNIRRVFQAFRIEVNQELDNLKEFLPKALNLLKPSGRLVVISFHSLEDRIVKQFFNQQVKTCVCPPEFPTCICGKTVGVRLLTRKPVTASEEEIAVNSRSKPAKLRAVEKIKN